MQARVLIGKKDGGIALRGKCIKQALLERENLDKKEESVWIERNFGSSALGIAFRGILIGELG